MSRPNYIFSKEKPSEEYILRTFFLDPPSIGFTIESIEDLETPRIDIEALNDVVLERCKKSGLGNYKSVIYKAICGYTFNREEDFALEVQFWTPKTNEEAKMNA